VTFSEEFEHIKAAIYDNPRADPGRLETCLSIALAALGEIAAGAESGEECAAYAQQELRRMEMRVRLGDDQPADITYPDWDYPEPRYMETLDSDERRGY
jgi:hypothetical protein